MHTDLHTWTSVCVHVSRLGCVSMSVWNMCVCVYVFKEVFLVPRPRRRPHPKGEGGGGWGDEECFEFWRR